MKEEIWVYSEQCLCKRDMTEWLIRLLVLCLDSRRWRPQRLVPGVRGVQEGQGSSRLKQHELYAYQRWHQQKCLVRWRAVGTLSGRSSTQQTREPPDLQWPGLSWRRGKYRFTRVFVPIRVVQGVREVQEVQQHRFFPRNLVHQGSSWSWMTSWSNEDSP